METLHEHKSTPGNHANGRNYLLTLDIGEKFQAFRYVRGGFKVPEAQDPIFTNAQTELANLVKNLLQRDTVHIISMRDLSANILSRAKQINDQLGQDCLIVSTCLEIAGPQAGQVLEVNRIVDFDGNIIGIGPRPGQMPLGHQISSIIHLANNRPIIIVEDGSFTGTTLTHLVRLFNDEIRKINNNKQTETLTKIKAIVLGFAFPEAQSHIPEIFKGELSIINCYENLDDWMPDHDFMPFTPNCGRTLGLIANQQPYPFYNQDGLPYSIPYLFPYLPMDKLRKWSGFKDASEDELYQFSQRCVNLTEKIFQKINELNGKAITLGDLHGCYPRSSIPYCLVRQRGETGIRYSPVDSLALTHTHEVVDILSKTNRIAREQIGYRAD